MHSIAGQARRQLPRQLRGQRLVVAEDEGWPADPGDDVRHDVRLAGAGDPAEDAESIPARYLINQSLDRGRLVAGRFEADG